MNILPTLALVVYVSTNIFVHFLAASEIMNENRASNACLRMFFVTKLLNFVLGGVGLYWIFERICAVYGV